MFSIFTSSKFDFPDEEARSGYTMPYNQIPLSYVAHERLTGLGAGSPLEMQATLSSTALDHCPQDILGQEQSPSSCQTTLSAGKATSASVAVVAPGHPNNMRCFRCTDTSAHPPCQWTPTSGYDLNILMWGMDQSMPDEEDTSGLIDRKGHRQLSAQNNSVTSPNDVQQEYLQGSLGNGMYTATVTSNLHEPSWASRGAQLPVDIDDRFDPWSRSQSRGKNASSGVQSFQNHVNDLEAYYARGHDGYHQLDSIVLSTQPQDLVSGMLHWQDPAGSPYRPVHYPLESSTSIEQSDRPPSTRITGLTDVNESVVKASAARSFVAPLSNASPPTYSISKYRKRGYGDLRCRFSCCEKKFWNVSDRTRHIQNVHNRMKPNPCPFCTKQMSRSDGLRRHIKENHNPNTSLEKIKGLRGNDHASGVGNVRRRNSKLTHL